MSSKKAIKAPFTKGVNFSNWMEFKNADQIDPDYFGRADFENVKKLGGDVVRIPIHFEQICSGTKELIIPDNIFAILDRLAEWAEELKMYLIFDFHNSTHADSATSESVEDVLTPIWTQMAEHFKDSTEYIIFELMNEPHNIEVALWNGIIERVFKKVRSIDKKHYIVAGGADWNSFAAMKTLPDFQDDKVIYTFHFYDPHTFTHQGASWCHMERVIGIPFPYDPEKMPPLPENPTEEEKQKFAAYPKQGSVEAVAQFFDQYVEFSVERNAPIFCGEFGCFIPFIPKEVRTNWYKIVTDLLVERGISRTSWDYYGGFGIFELTGHRRPSFPEDLNRDVVQALGLSLENI